MLQGECFSTVVSETHRVEETSCTSMVEPKEVALRSGKSLAPAAQQSYTLTPIEDPKNEWKKSVDSVVHGRMKGK